MFKQQLSPLWIVTLIAIALAIIAGLYLLLMHRHQAVPGTAAVSNDPYANQYSAPPAKSSPEGGGVAP